MPRNHPDLPPDPCDPDPIRQAAAEWFAEQRGGLSEDRRRELARWLETDPRHAEIFAELEETWELLGRARPSPLTAVSAPPRRRIWARLAPPLAAAAVLALAWIGFSRLRPALGSSAAARTFTENATTGVGEQQRLALPDGSVLQINTDSAVEVRLTPDEREVRLTRGEVQFQVARNPSRPFVVNVDGLAVQDVGTIFDVRLRPESVDILVTEGRVRVVDAGGDQSLGAGEALAISRAGAGGAAPRLVKVDSAAIGRALAWRQHQLEFDSESLAAVAAEFNRYNRHKLVIADPELAARRFGGTFPTDDYGALVRLLQKSFGVTAEDRGDVTVLRSAP